MNHTLLNPTFPASILKFSSMTEKQKEKYLNYYNTCMLSGAMGYKYLKPKKNFDKNGLKFPIKYLNSVGKHIIFLPVELMAEHADAVTTNYIKEGNNKFINSCYADLQHVVMVDGMESATYYPTINATAIGNVAYIYLHAEDLQLKYTAEAWLNALFNRHRIEFAKQLSENIVKSININPEPPIE